MILRAFFFGTVLYAFIWSKRNFSFSNPYSSCFFKKLLIDIIFYLFLFFEEFHSWCVGRAVRDGILVKSQEFFFHPLTACCGGRVNIFQKKKQTLNYTMPPFLQSATNKPDWCSTCVHLGEKVFVNWLAIAVLPFEQIIWANFFSNIYSIFLK